MLPPFWATPPPFSKIDDISDNYEQISTKFPVISLLTRKWVSGIKMLKCVTPSWATPLPYSKISDISGNYEQISTKFSVISLLATRWVLGKTNIEIHPHPHSNIGSFLAKSTRPPDVTISDFDKNWYRMVVFGRENNIPKFLKYLVKYGLKYGSVNFDQKATTSNGQTLISRILWDLLSPTAMIFVSDWRYLKIIWANWWEPLKIMKTIFFLSFKPLNLNHKKSEFLKKMCRLFILL